MTNIRSALDQQVRRVHRQLRRKSILAALPLGWTAALLVLALFLLAKPFVDRAFEVPVLLATAVAFVLGTGLGVALGLRRAPAARDAALAIDEHCGLKERVVTAYTLPAELVDSPVGQAVLEDAGQRLAQADLHRSFAPPQRKRDFLWPLLAGGLALGAFFLGPHLASWFRLGVREDVRPLIDPAHVQRELENLRKVSAFQKNDEAPRSKEMEDLAAEWDKLINKPLDPANQEHVRERAREIQDFKDKLREAADKLAAKNKDREEALAKLFDGKADRKEGPAKDLADALAKGDFAKARDALERLQKKLKDKKLDKEEEAKLAEQLKDIEERLRRLADQDQKKADLAKEHKEGKLNDAELARELERLAELAENLKDLAELGEMMKGWQEQMKLDPANAEKMEKMLGALKKMELGKGDLKKLQEEMRRLEEAQAALCLLCEGKDGKKNNGLGAGKNPGGRRPIAEKDPDGKIIESPEHGKVDPKGKLHVTGPAWGGGSFVKIPAKEVGGVVTIAAQEAPEVIERQRIPPEAADLARGYFEKLGGQK